LEPDHNPLIANHNQPVPGWALLLFFGALIVLGVGASLLLREILTLEQPELPAMGLFYGVALVSAVIAVLPMGPAAVAALAIRGAGWRPVLLGAAGTLVLSFVASQFGPELQGMEDIQRVIRQPDALVPSILILGVLAPLVEELFFRGLVYGWLDGRWGWRSAFIMSSLLFAAAHFQWQAAGWYRLAYVLAVLPLGLLFGWLRRRTGSLLPSFAAHVANNSFAVVTAAYFSP
jgi:membrane protease YdiL (CAAX protease family)